MTEEEIVNNLRAGKRWCDKGMPISPPKGVTVPLTKERYHLILDMHGELIEEQRAEISKLKMRINKLEMQHDKQIRNK